MADKKKSATRLDGPPMTGFLPFFQKCRDLLGIAVWRTSYEVEEAREYHAMKRNYLRQAACCIGLYFLSLVGAAGIA